MNCGFAAIGGVRGVLRYLWSKYKYKDMNACNGVRKVRIRSEKKYKKVCVKLKIREVKTKHLFYEIIYTQEEYLSGMYLQYLCTY